MKIVGFRTDLLNDFCERSLGYLKPYKIEDYCLFFRSPGSRLLVLFSWFLRSTHIHNHYRYLAVSYFSFVFNTKILFNNSNVFNLYLNFFSPASPKTKFRKKRKNKFICSNKFFSNFHLSRIQVYLSLNSGKWVSAKTVYSVHAFVKYQVKIVYRRKLHKFV